MQYNFPKYIVIHEESKFINTYAKIVDEETFKHEWAVEIILKIDVLKGACDGAHV